MPPAAAVVRFDEMGRLVGIIYATGTIEGEDRALAIPAIALLSHLTDTP